MKLRINKKWHKNKDLEGLLFFAQKLDELYFDYTLDTYKPPALISIYLCREAIELIDDIEEDLIDKQNLVNVLDELEWSLRSDIVAKSMLEAPIEKFVLNHEGVKLTEIKIRLEVLEKTLNSLTYTEICQELLKKEIIKKSKINISNLSKIYASSLINHGISKQHLNDKTKEFFFNGKELTSCDDVDFYFELVTPVVHHFEIYFIASKLISEVKKSTNAFNLEIIKTPPKAVLNAANKANLKPSEDEVWVEVKEIQAFDRHTARKHAESNLNMIRDLFLLFSHKNRIYWRDETIITQCCDETPIVIRKPKNSMEKCFDLRAKDASIRLNDLISTINLHDTSFIKFNRAVDLHGIGSTNDLAENQLLNIWIALETLVPSHVHGGGKVTKVCNGIMPILLRNYLKRIIARVTSDLVNWNRPKTSYILRKIPNSKGKSLYKKVLELITLDEHEELRKELYKSLGHFHLLRFRIFELNALFCTPKSLIERIGLHEKKASWQIRRIYRTRNFIVHSGRSPAYIEALIENSHDYLDQVMSSIIDYSCGYLNAETLDQIFDMSKLDYDVYIQQLKSIDTFTADNIEFLI